MIKLEYKSIDNYQWEIRHAILSYNDLEMFIITFSKGNSHSVGHYMIVQNPKCAVVGSIGGSVTEKGYANLLSKKMAELGFEISPEDILNGLENRKKENKQAIIDGIDAELKGIKNQISQHNSSVNLLQQQFKKLTKERNSVNGNN